MAEEDLLRSREQKKVLEEELQMALLPRDVNADRNIILETPAPAPAGG